MLTQEQVEIVRDAMIDAINVSYARIVDRATKTNVDHRLLELIVQINVSQVFTPDGIRRMSQTVYGDSVFRNFIMNLTTSFLMRIGNSEKIYDRLVEQLAWASALYVKDEDSNGSKDPAYAAPEEISSRAVALNDIKEVLDSNRWMVSLLLVREYLQVPKTTETRRGVVTPTAETSNGNGQAMRTTS